MAYVIVGLGNPGPDYENTRHNTGRILLDYIRTTHKLPEWKANSKLKALVSEGEISGKKVKLIMPETFMNKSGFSVAPLVTSVKRAGELVVIYDDLDLPIGKVKMSFNRSSGGHKGIESIIKAVKTEAFIRIRAGISAPAASKKSGGVKKVQGDEKVMDFIIGKFKPAELAAIKSLGKQVSEAVEMILSEGKDKAMTIANSK